MEDFETTDKYTAWFFKLWLFPNMSAKSHLPFIVWILIIGLGIEWIPTMWQEPYLVLFVVNKHYHWQQWVLLQEFTSNSSSGDVRAPWGGWCYFANEEIDSWKLNWIVQGHPPPPNEWQSLDLNMGPTVPKSLSCLPRETINSFPLQNLRDFKWKEAQGNLWHNMALGRFWFRHCYIDPAWDLGQVSYRIYLYWLVIYVLLVLKKYMS